LPNLDLALGYTTTHGNNVLRSADYFKDTRRHGSWYVGLSLSFPLQNRAALGEKARNTELLRVAGERLSLTQRGILAEVQETISNLELAHAGIPVAWHALESARETVKGEEERFNIRGGIGNRDLLASHDALGHTEITWQTAVAHYHIALAEHQFARAALLDRYRIRIGPRGVDMDAPVVAEPEWESGP